MRRDVATTGAIGVIAILSLAAQTQPVMKYGIRVQPGPMDSVLLKDYAPETSLVTPENHPGKARFPVIDVHSHTGQSHIATAQDVDAWVRTMDDVGVETTVVFTGATGAEFDRQVELFSRHSKRFQLYCSLDTSRLEDPGYPQRAAAELERCYRKGARGVGEITDKGSGIQKEKLPRDKRLHFGDARLKPVWDKCAELKLPVNVHIADHPANWKPLGPHQERTADFQAFNQYGKDVLSYEELIGTRRKLLAQNPRTTFIACHLGNQGNDLAALAKELDASPNLYLDISARDYEVGRQPRAAAKFLERYRDRVLFGTDMERDPAMYRGWWRLLQTADEFIPGRLWWRYYGLELKPDVLEHIYRKNARKVLNWQPL
ncbi:MAG TPA: amidohydrolase family protein, partial [Bryobacteraceae bacterium]|nr:amidohydrolase family protein [Bryobacteraceae bacterium]